MPERSFLFEFHIVSLVKTFVLLILFKPLLIGANEAFPIRFASFLVLTLKRSVRLTIPSFRFITILQFCLNLSRMRWSSGPRTSTYPRAKAPVVSSALFEFLQTAFPPFLLVNPVNCEGNPGLTVCLFGLTLVCVRVQFLLFPYCSTFTASSYLMKSVSKHSDISLSFSLSLTFTSTNFSYETFCFLSKHEKPTESEQLLRNISSLAWNPNHFKSHIVSHSARQLLLSSLFSVSNLSTQTFRTSELAPLDF